MRTQRIAVRRDGRDNSIEEVANNPESSQNVGYLFSLPSTEGLDMALLNGLGVEELPEFRFE
jgi:hypothetical protein